MTKHTHSDLPRDYVTHGHVVPHPSGLLARCGGPSVCGTCKLEKAYLQLLENYRECSRRLHSMTQAASVAEHQLELIRQAAGVTT